MVASSSPLVAMISRAHCRIRSLVPILGGSSVVAIIETFILRGRGLADPVELRQPKSKRKQRGDGSRPFRQLTTARPPHARPEGHPQRGVGRPGGESPARCDRTSVIGCSQLL